MERKRRRRHEQQQFKRRRSRIRRTLTGGIHRAEADKSNHMVMVMGSLSGMDMGIALHAPVRDSDVFLTEREKGGNHEHHQIQQGI